MKYQFTTILSAIAAAVCVVANGPDYATLLADCQAAGGNVFASVLYGGSTGVVNYSFGDCIPLTMGGNEAQEAVTCQASTCGGYLDGDCTILLASENVPSGSDLVNSGGTVIPGDSAKCTTA